MKYAPRSLPELAGVKRRSLFADNWSFAKLPSNSSICELVNLVMLFQFTLHPGNVRACTTGACTAHMDKMAKIKAYFVLLGKTCRFRGFWPLSPQNWATS